MCIFLLFGNRFLGPNWNYKMEDTSISKFHELTDFSGFLHLFQKIQIICKRNFLDASIPEFVELQFGIWQNLFNSSVCVCLFLQNEMLRNKGVVITLLQSICTKGIIMTFSSESLNRTFWKCFFIKWDVEKQRSCHHPPPEYLY